MKMIHMTVWSTALAALTLSLSLTGCEKKQEPAAPSSVAPAAAAAEELCIVSGHAIGSGGMKAATYEHEGRTIRFCCESCIDDFKKEPAKYLAKLDAAKLPTAPAPIQTH